MSISVLYLLCLACVAFASPLAADVDGIVLNERDAQALAQRGASNGGTVQAGLTNIWLEQGQGGGYYITIDVGTPPQSLQLVLDTGSSDFWMYSAKFRGNNGGACFNETESTTGSSVDLPPLHVVYGTGPYNIVNGSFMADNINMGGAVLNNVTFGMVETGHDWGSSFGGILGLGWDFIEADRVRVGVEYPNVVDLLYNEGYISSHTYSVHMDDINSNLGSILFGGYDTRKYTGPQIVLTTESNALSVPLQAVSITDASGSRTQLGFYETPIRAFLDTGSALGSPLPEDTYTALVQYIVGLGYSISDGDSPRVDCGLRNAQGSVDLTFTDTTGNETTNHYFNNTGTIAVQFSELAVPYLTGPSGDIQWCDFGFSNAGPGSDPLVIIGNACMRSMYAIFALDYGVIALAQSRFNATGSNITPVLWQAS